MLFAAHSGLRYLVLLAGVLLVLYALAGLLGRRKYSTRVARLAAVFAGLLHMQVLTGIAVLFTRPFYTAIIGHLFLMLAAAAVAQLAGSVVKRRPRERKSYGPHLVGAVLALGLVAAGVMAIGRGVLQSTM